MEKLHSSIEFNPLIMDNDMFVMKTKKSEMVLPSSTITPHVILPLISLDLFKPEFNSTFCFFYNSNGYTNVLDFGLLKEALAKTLAVFYPFAGRLRRNRNGRLEIVCNGEGVLLVEVEADATIQDIRDFTPSPNLDQLNQLVDYTGDKSSLLPIIHLQVTRFKCGGVSLGIGNHGYIGDAQTFLDFVDSWSRIARGEDIDVHPFMDRTILQARDPPTPIFPHGEYNCHPPLKTYNYSKPSSTTKTLIKVTRAQLDLMKARCKGEASTFVSLTIHVWQCVTRARRLSDDQDTKLIIPYSGRQRLGIPSGYVGNVTFLAAVTLKAGQVVASDISVLAREIKESFNAMTEEYLRSAIDFLELQIRKTRPVKEEEEGEEKRKESNAVSIFVMNNLLRLPYYDADFGWGKPYFVGPMKTLEDVCTVIPSCPTSGDGSVFLVIELKEDQMTEFMKLFYDLVQ